MRLAASSPARLVLALLVVIVAFWVAFAVAKAGAGDDQAGRPAATKLRKKPAAPKLPRVSPPAALPALRAAAAPTGGGAPIAA